MALTFATNNTITDSDSGFASFNDNDYIQIMGTVNNDGYYQIETATAAMFTLRDDALDNYGSSNALVAETGSLNDIGIVKTNFVPSGPNKSASFPARKRCAAMHSVLSDGTEEFANSVDNMQWMQVETHSDLFDVTPSTRCGEAKHKYGRGRVKGLNTQGAKIIMNSDLLNGEFTNVASPNNVISDPMFTGKTQMLLQHSNFLMVDGQVRIQGNEHSMASGGGHFYDGTFNQGSYAYRWREFGWSFIWNDMLESGIDWFIHARSNTYWITNDGRLWCAGNNDNNQNGESYSSAWAGGDVKSVPSWIRGASDSLVGKRVKDFDVCDANSTEQHCILLTDDYKVWCWGENRVGQCATTSNTGDNVAFPTQVTAFSAKNMIAVYAHGRYDSGICAAIEEDGTPWTWGGNNYGQLGDGTTTNRSSPVNPVNLPNQPCIGIAGMGGYSASTYRAVTFFIMQDHSIYGCGSNAYGALGDGSTADKSTPTRVLLDDNSSPETTAYPIKLITNSGGFHHGCCAIMSDWTVRTWGYNGHGQCGTGNTSNQSIPYNPMAQNDEAYGFIDAHFNNNGDTSIALFLLRFDGTVWSAGYNANGVLGKGSDEVNFDHDYYPFTDNWEDSYGSDGYHTSYGEGSPEGQRVFTPIPFGNNRVQALASWGNADSSQWTMGLSDGGYALGWGYTGGSHNWSLTNMEGQDDSIRPTPQGGPMPNVR